jgi:hypothetical protein
VQPPASHISGRPTEPHTTQPQTSPSVSRLQSREHDVFCCAQLPLWQVNALHVHDAGAAASSHGPENAHALQVIVLGAHVVPFVLRVQPTVHAVLVGVQVSFWHANDVHVQL